MDETQENDSYDKWIEAIKEIESGIADIINNRNINKFLTEFLDEIDDIRHFIEVQTSDDETTILTSVLNGGDLETLFSLKDKYDIGIHMYPEAGLILVGIY